MSLAGIHRNLYIVPTCRYLVVCVIRTVDTWSFQRLASAQVNCFFSSHCLPGLSFVSATVAWKSLRYYFYYLWIKSSGRGQALVSLTLFLPVSCQAFDTKYPAKLYSVHIPKNHPAITPLGTILCAFVCYIGPFDRHTPQYPEIHDATALGVLQKIFLPSHPLRYYFPL